MGKADFHNTEKWGAVTIADWEEHTHVGGQETGPAYKATNFPAVQLRVHESGDTTYVGESKAGALTSEAVWRVKKIVETGGQTSITWANEAAWNQIYDDRAVLTYS